MPLIRVSDETKDRLTKFNAALTLKNGKARTFDDAVRELLDFYEEKVNA